MRILLAIGLGGFVGSIARYLITLWVDRLSRTGTFPWGTLGVNVAGSLAIGLIAGLAQTTQIFSPTVRLFLLVGCLGGFTTFSTFSYDTLAMLRDGRVVHAAAYMGIHLVLGLCAVSAGYAISTYRV